MGVARAVVVEEFPLDGFAGGLQVDVELSFGGRCGQQGDFQGVEGAADVALGVARDVVEGVVVDGDGGGVHAQFGVGQRAAHQADQGGFVVPLELEDLGAR